MCMYVCMYERKAKLASVRVHDVAIKRTNNFNGRLYVPISPIWDALRSFKITKCCHFSKGDKLAMYVCILACMYGHVQW